MNYEDPFDPSLSQVALELRSWGGVAVVGAGLSVLSGIPLASGLNTLVWHALDADPDAFQEVANGLGEAAASAKVLIGDHEGRLRHAYSTIRCYPKARSVFQHGFVKRNNERASQPSPAHESLAALFHANHIELVISLNWDSLFEAAYERLYGRWLKPDDSLFCKPHGDVAFPDEPWILPGEDGRVPDRLVQKLREISADKPRLLLIAGYSELDEAVVQKLIEPLSRGWRVARIGPNAEGELAIPLPADQALPRLLKLVDPRPIDSPWAVVRFGQQHDLGPALSGEGLGPADIAALPALPESNAAITRLKTAYRGIISGDSGCGKSGTAYRVAQAFHVNGYEVIRLAKPISTARELTSSLEGLRFPTLALIDDAHRLAPDSFTELGNRAGPDFLVLGVTTAGESAGPQEIRIDAKRAVSIIAGAMKKNRPATLALVQKLDNHVGDGYLQDSLEGRIRYAAEQAFPWQFTFVLTGGWRRVGQHLVNARASGRADMLLFAIAAHQLLTLDGAPGASDLAVASSVFGFQYGWVSDCLQRLTKLRLITSSESPKCPHLRHATVVIQTIFNDMNDSLRPAALTYLDAVLARSEFPLRGVYWLIDALRFTDGLWGIRNTILSEATRKMLVDRSFGAKSSVDRAAAGLLLSVLDDFIPDWNSVLAERISDISALINAVDGVSAWGLARFLNDIDRDHHAIVNAALSNVNPGSFAIKLQNAPIEQLPGFSEFLDRLAQVGRDGFASSLRHAWSPAAIAILAKAAAAQGAYVFGKLMRALHCFDEAFTLFLMDQNLNAMAEAFAQEPLEAFEALQDVIWFGGLWIAHAPSRMQKQLAKRLCRHVKVANCARSIEKGRLSDLERWARFLSFLKRADPTRAAKIICEISLDRLDRELAPLWAKPTSELEHFVKVLALRPELEPSRSWIKSHQAELQEIPPRFAIIAPEVCAEALRNGGRIAYPETFGLHWQELMAALECLAGVDRDVTGQSVRKEVEALARSLTTHQANLYEKSDAFLDIAEEVSPGITQAIIERIDPESAIKHWPQLHSGNAAQRRAVAKLLGLAANHSGPLGEAALALRGKRLHRGTNSRKRDPRVLNRSRQA